MTIALQLDYIDVSCFNVEMRPARKRIFRWLVLLFVVSVCILLVFYYRSPFPVSSATSSTRRNVESPNADAAASALSVGARSDVGSSARGRVYISAVADPPKTVRSNETAASERAPWRSNSTPTRESILGLVDATATAAMTAHRSEAITTEGTPILSSTSAAPARSECDVWLGGRRRGFALSISYWDQQTWSMGNILSLQKWAHSLDMAVVQPFLVGTKFKTPAGSIGTSDLPMDSLYDMEFWNKHNRNTEYAPLVNWECFLQNAPRQIILIYLDSVVDKCLIKELRTKTELLQSHGFHIVREKCIYRQAGRKNGFSLSEFKSLVLGNYSAQSVTVVFQEWCQHTAGSILDMNAVRSPTAIGRYIPIKPSEAVLQDVQKYTEKYLGGEYIAILLRIEWVVMNVGLSGFARMTSCLYKTLRYFEAVREHFNISSVFVGMDIGKYGTSTMSLRKYTDIIEKHFLGPIYPGSNMTISKWEDTFAEISRTQVPGYVGLLQKLLAARGKCLLLIGSGSYQSQAFFMYKEFHQRSKLCFLRSNSKCDAFNRYNFAGFTPQVK